MITDVGALLRALAAHQVRHVLVGGAAAVAHGSARLTQDVDVVYARDPVNVAALVAALAPTHPYLRGAPPGLPFRWDDRTVRNDLDTLIAVKRAAGRPKDLEAIAELEAIRDRRGGDRG